jgi:chorismate-pyruvate lyase
MAMNEPFDPLSDLFVAQFAKPAQLGAVNLRALTPFQRALLVIDGTVTKFIEAYTLEPVETIRIGQERRRLSADQPWLEAAAGIEVLARSVYLKGKYSGTVHAYAISLVVPDRLPEPLRELLKDEAGSLGRILLDNRMETRRDVLWYGREPLQDLPDPIRHLVGGEVISRTYRIILGGQPVMLINEKFPSGPDPLPSHD